MNLCSFQLESAYWYLGEKYWIWNDSFKWQTFKQNLSITLRGDVNLLIRFQYDLGHSIVV